MQGRYPRDDSNDEDFHQRAAEHASRNAGGSGGADFFSGILGNFMGKKDQLANEEVDEQGTFWSLCSHKSIPGHERDSFGYTRCYAPGETTA